VSALRLTAAQITAGEVRVAQVAVEEVGLGDLAADKGGLAQAEADERGIVEDALGERQTRELAEPRPVDAHQLALAKVNVVGPQPRWLHARQVAALEPAVLEAARGPAGLLKLASAKGAASQLAGAELAALELEAGEHETLGPVGVQQLRERGLGRRQLRAWWARHGGRAS